MLVSGFTDGSKKARREKPARWEDAAARKRASRRLGLFRQPGGRVLVRPALPAYAASFRLCRQPALVGALELYQGWQATDLGGLQEADRRLKVETAASVAPAPRPDRVGAMIIGRIRKADGAPRRGPGPRTANPRKFRCGPAATLTSLQVVCPAAPGSGTLLDGRQHRPERRGRRDCPRTRQPRALLCVLSIRDPLNPSAVRRRREMARSTTSAQRRHRCSDALQPRVLGAQPEKKHQRWNAGGAGGRFHVGVMRGTISPDVSATTGSVLPTAGRLMTLRLRDPRGWAP